ncbi:M23 family metallopeptidase [Jannaschia sp. Os4]|uniref:peptidoglycan DD-metalloendopeptidase family protein n=1 Tax=Jannaschia sp. Os4 TaxID=2807617 RepID=UPI001939E35A|nr:peptidoglycan DD-metalloendopeptidase family protein [Jannaschia sp. Os4]MBM2578063.1 M23 family metallopeptidase [Jannaschia sp. Os4]
MEVDPKFRAARARARARRARRAGGRALLWGVLPAALAGAALWAFTDVPARVADGVRDAVHRWQVAGDADETLVQIEHEIVVAPVVTGNAFAHIPGDPTILRLPPEAVEDGLARVTGPAMLDISRFGLPRPERVAVLRDDLVVTESRLMTVLPSSREEFAFLQQQQDRAARDLREAMADPAALAELAGLDLAGLETEEGLGEDSYGVEIAGLEDGGVPAPSPAVAAAPVEETSLTFLRREALRVPLFEDVVLRAEQPRDLGDLLAESPLEDRGRPLADQVAAVLPDAARLPRGGLVALRLVDGGARASHVTVIGPDGYLGTVAPTPSGALPAADPWVGEGLSDLAVGAAPEAGATFRLMDAIYSAALRAGVPSDLAGSFTAVLAQDLDLERPAREGERIVLAFAEDHGPGGGADGQLMYAALEGGSETWRCYVVPDESEGGFRCHVPGRAARGAATLVAPVEGVLTSRYGPRRHPILKTVRLHAGVDWAAPTGTPVRAAMAGRIVRRGTAGGYGNLVAIAHPGGLETRYAHLHRFAPGQEVGTEVAAGEVIGQVGTTGRSTGPHLHFETRLAGEPTDPMPLLTGERVIATAPAEASGAVEALVSQIIRVESAGNARAKNPLSTATGLGQFIESTWLRMMRTYRPDLVATLNRGELLRLRFDPTLSREMVTRLAQENERYLRSRGHAITAGRLYLAHFLGPGGADKVLSTRDDVTILALMGAGVVRANPFLRNYDVADLKAWADRKMRGRGQAAPATVAAAPPPPPDPKVEAYVELVDDVLAAAG